MDAYFRPTRVEISLDALGANIRAFRGAIPSGMKLMASVKANAYGHGAVQIAREAEACGADYLGVAFLDEALQLRNGGCKLPILVLGYVPAEGLELAREHDISIALFREDIMEAAASLPLSFKKLKVHIKVDSGMGRLGKAPGGEAEAFIERVFQVPTLEIEGLFTHFAKADEADKSYTKLQVERFERVVRYVRDNQLPIPIIHSANSAAGIDTPEWGGEMLRLGIGMYGLYPSAEVNQSLIQLQPVMSLKTEIVMVKTAPPGSGISYGSRYVTAAEEKIGTLPIGYADGYSRMLSGSAEVLLRGRKVPVRGTICMDQCMISLDEVDGSDDHVQLGEEVVLIGRQGAQQISAGDVADKLGTINYEVTCMIASRVPRVYTREGKIVEISNGISY